MKNILLLTDFSKNAQNAIDYALQFFKGARHHFYLLYVHKVSNYTMGNLMASSGSIYDSIIKDPKAGLKAMIEEFEKRYPTEDYSFEAICDYDSFISAVSQTITLKNINLIVMGTNGATGAKEVLFGSNTLSVIRNINYPVLVIPQGYHYVKPAHILYVIEYKGVFERGSLQPLVEVLAKHHSELDILALTDGELVTDTVANEIAAFFMGTPLNFHSISNVKADVAINCFVQLKNIDLIAKVICKETFIKRVLSGSSTHKITYQSSMPLLIMHP